MAEVGRHVTGLDNAAAMLALAQAKLAERPQEEQAHVTLIEADMAAFSLSETFGLVIVPYNTFMHLDGAAALADAAWRKTALRRLARGRMRLDALGAAAGWELLGGCDLFRTFRCDDAARVQARLAELRIWTRKFDYAPTWLRLGLPGNEKDWARLEAAMAGLGQ